jgi:hypothetical protein
VIGGLDYRNTELGLIRVALRGLELNLHVQLEITPCIRLLVQHTVGVWSECCRPYQKLPSWDDSSIPLDFREIEPRARHVQYVVYIRTCTPSVW